MSKTIEKNVLWDGLDKQIVHPAIGVYNNDDKEHFYFGISLPTSITIENYKKDHDGNTVASRSNEQKYMPFIARDDQYLDPDEEAIEFSVKPTNFNRWEIENIKWFYETKHKDMSLPVINEYELLQDITELLKQHIELQNEGEYLLLALWIFGTYLHNIFNTFPYLFAYGSKGSGKSKLLYTVSYLAFNGQMLAKPSSSNIFRLINNCASTLAIDEIDLSDLKDDNSKDLHSILLSGYKADAKVPRSSEKNLNEIQFYSIYSPKLLAGSKELADMVRDRSIELVMVKSRRSFPILQDNVIHRDLRNKLYCWALENWMVVKDYYEKYETDMTFIGRERELWYPILALAEAFDMKDTVLELAKNKTQTHRTDESIESEERKIIRTLDKIVKGDGWFLLKDIKTAFIEDLIDLDENTDWVKERYVSRLLKKLGVVADKEMPQNRVKVLIHRKKIEELMTNYDIKPYPNQPNDSISNNNTSLVY